LFLSPDEIKEATFLIYGSGRVVNMISIILTGLSVAASIGEAKFLQGRDGT
jgi:hypothetical protein